VVPQDDIACCRFFSFSRSILSGGSSQDRPVVPQDDIAGCRFFSFFLGLYRLVAPQDRPVAPQDNIGCHRFLSVVTYIVRWLLPIPSCGYPNYLVGGFLVLFVAHFASVLLGVDLSASASNPVHICSVDGTGFFVRVHRGGLSLSF